jgi:protein TonB
VATTVKTRPGALWATDADVEKPKVPMGLAIGLAFLLVILVGFGLSQIDMDKVLDQAKNITKAVIIEDKPPPPPPPPPPEKPPEVKKIVKKVVPVDTPPPPTPTPEVPPAPPSIPVAENPSPNAPAIGNPQATGPAVAPAAPQPVGKQSVGMACPNQPKPDTPQRVTRSGAVYGEIVLRVQARISNGKVTDVNVVDYQGPSEFRNDFRRAVENVVKQYRCEVSSGEVLAEQEFVFRPSN